MVLCFNKSQGGKVMNSTKRNRTLIITFILPAILIFSLFIIYPLVTTVYKSGFVFNGFKLGKFVGFKNYIDTLKDPVFWHVNTNTLKLLAVQLLLAGPLSFLLAVVVNTQGPKFRKYFKIAVFLPAVLNVAVISLMWKMMLQPDWGTVDVILTKLGLQDHIILWLSDKTFAIWIIGFVVLWQYIGFNMLFFYAGVRSIPTSYFEAATVEGAGFWRKTLHISIPLCQEIIKFVLIISITGTMQIFTQIQLLTNGGPGDLTRSLVFQMYYKAFSISNFAQANSIAVLFAIETFTFVLIVNRFIARDRIQYT
jgi:multiple sugar transport system permease protein/raffinose/stachyose/melibiose transport system permease protein